MTAFSHLLPEAAAKLKLPDDERIEEMLRDQWIGYPKAGEILARMEELLKHPKIVRMPNLLVIGRTNNGKTHILRRFQELHPACDNEGGEAASVPIVFVQAPAIPDEKRFYAAILRSIFAKFSVSDHPDKLLENVKDKFKKLGVRMLIIDELNSLISGSSAKQRQFLVVLKHLSNDLQIPFVGAGTEDAVRAIQTDPQLANRFPPINLPRWTLDKGFQRLLATCERILPLREPSDLSKKDLAHEIWSKSEGSIGETITLLKRAAKHAIKTGRERIDAEMLNECGYESPSLRKKRLLDV